MLGQFVLRQGRVTGMIGALGLILIAASGCQAASSVLGQRYPSEDSKTARADADASACGNDARTCIEQCKGGDAKACNAAAIMLEFGITGPQDYRQASRLYGEACRIDFAQGCNNLGWMFALGKGVDRSPTTAMVLFTKAFDGYRMACMSGEIQGCLLATNLLRQGLVNNADDTQVAVLTERACSLGHEPSCSDPMQSPY